MKTKTTLPPYSAKQLIAEAVRCNRADGMIKVILHICLVVISLTAYSQDRSYHVNCDLIYSNSNISIDMKYIEGGHWIDSVPFNTIMQVSNSGSLILCDSIFSHSGEIIFEDFDGDGTKDVMVQNMYDVRSNAHYNLYVFEKNLSGLKRIKGFENIKNPKYNNKYDIIENYVASGKNWTSFYQIKSDSIQDFGYIIYDDLTEESTYLDEYEKAIIELSIIMKNN